MKSIINRRLNTATDRSHGQWLIFLLSFLLYSTAPTATFAEGEDHILRSKRNVPPKILVRQNPGFKPELAATPPMGWNSWNTFRCDIDEHVIRETADAMVSSGMKDAGYEYIIIDDCWQVGRDKEGVLIADPKKFPSGISALADYIHKKGLKFGIYSSAGPTTCANRPGGSKGYEWTDAKTFAAWGVDYLKYDWCGTDFDHQSPIDSYVRMRDALVATGRDIVFSICDHGRSDPWRWGSGVGHLWRTFKDIRPCFDCRGHRATNGVLSILDHSDSHQLFRYSGPGRWNDPDMLEVGNPGLNGHEARSHFGLWAVLSAPLIAGNDLRTMSDETREILTNKEVITINQDRLGNEAFLYRDYNNGTQIWRKWLAPLENGDAQDALLLLNRNDHAKEITFYLDPKATVRDVWKKRDLGNFKSGVFTAKVPAHGSVLVRVSGMKKKT